jgi:allophanate hydrolase subunit 2
MAPALDVSVDPVAAMRGGHGRLRVLPGPHAEWFETTAITGLPGQRYEVTSHSNRMGYRLEGPAITWRRHSEVISTGTTIGALQVPRSGQPILLMADRQTTGGYPTIATVIAADLGVAGQLAPGDSVEFAACSLDDALLAARAQEETLLSVEREARP